MISRHVSFPCGDEWLEGVLQVPSASSANGPLTAVVVCHPHPLYGGDMDNNVVTAVCFSLVGSSIAALRFNFRGVGVSGGSYGNGIGEQDDLRAALDFLSSLPEINHQKIGLAGYSFGGAVALSVAVKDQRVKQLALISPALDQTGWMQFKEYTSPKLLLIGDNDTAVSFRPFSDAKQYQIITGADHFWSGFEEVISKKIASFFKSDFY